MRNYLFSMSKPTISTTLMVLLLTSVFIGIPAVPLIANMLNVGGPLPPSFEANPQSFFSGVPESSSSIPDPLANIDKSLHSWLRTGMAPDNIRQYDPGVGIFFGTTFDVDFAEVSRHVQILNVFPMGLGFMVEGYVQNPKDIYALNALDGTGAIMGDIKIEYEEISPGDEIVLDQFFVQDVIETDLVQANYPSIDGSGVAIAIQDTGVDFTVTNLANRMHRNSTGHVTSYDPNGGITVSAITTAAAGNSLLWIPSDFGVTRYPRSGSFLHYYTSYGFMIPSIIPETGEWWQVQTGYGTDIRRIESKSGFFKFGCIVANTYGYTGNPDFPAGRSFFFWILVDETTPFVYDTLYIDWETSWAATAMFNGISTSVTPDWDFTNNEPHRWGDGTEVLAVDFDGDGFNDWGLGALANAYDRYGGINRGIINGIHPSGAGFAFMSDIDYYHGTLCAATAVGQSIQPFDAYDNGTLYYTPGSAPGADIMALKGIYSGDIWHCWFWGSGYRPFIYEDWLGELFGLGPASTDYAKFHMWRHTIYDPAVPADDFSNQAHIISNSWGWGAHEFTNYAFIWGVDYWSFGVDFLSNGGIGEDYYNVTGTWWDAYYGTNPAYPDGAIAPGPLFVISAGNAGPGAGTMGSPCGVTSLSVGASSTMHFLQQLYNNDSSLGPQPFDQISQFSSAGPTPQSLPKPDVVAPGAWQFVPGPTHLGRGNGNNTLWEFGGTSASAPLTAGVAALVFQAIGVTLGSIPPGEVMGMIKTIIKGTCDDLNYPALRQGSGRINAFKAVNWAFMNETTDGVSDYIVALVSPYTFANFASGGGPGQPWNPGGDNIAGWWRAWYMQMEPLGAPLYGNFGAFIYASGNYTGNFVQHMDAGFATHQMLPGDSEVIPVMAATPGMPGSDVDSLDAVWYEEVSSSTHTFTSTSVYTTYPLFGSYSGIDNFDDIFQSQFMTADYAIISLSTDHATFEDLYALAGYGNYAFLHDWNDTNGNGVIDLHAVPTDPIGEVRRVAWDTGSTACHEIHVGNPGAQWVGDQNATIYYHDVGNEVFLYRSLDVTVTIRLFNRVDWDWFSFSQTAPFMWDVTCTVPGDADPGIYAGFISATKAPVTEYFPVTVRVDGQVGPGSSLTWGGSDGHPYDNGAITGAINYDGGRYLSGAWRYYIIDITDIDVGENFTSWVMTNVTWQDPGTVVDVFIYMTGYGARALQTVWGNVGDSMSDTEYDTDGHWIGEPTWTDPPQNVLLTEWSWDVGVSATIRGYLMIALHVSSYGGLYVPENLTITVTPLNNETLGLPFNAELPGPTGEIRATSITGDPVVTDDDVLAGPHLTLEGTFDPFSVPGLPTVGIRETDLQFLISDRIEIHGLFTEANATPDTASGGPYDYEYVWEGIVAGQLLELALTVPEPPDGPGVPGDPPHDCELFLLSPIGAVIGTSTRSGSVEDFSLIAPTSGDYTIGVDYWGVDAGSYYFWGGWSGPWGDGLPWILTASASAIIPHVTAGLTSAVDTHELGLNTAIDLLLKGWTGTSLDYGTLMNIVVTNVSVTNFYEPVLQVTYPNGGEVLPWAPFNITWTASDLNLDETLQFLVEASNDTGATWKVIVLGTLLQQATWDPTSAFYGFPAGDQFLIRVNVSDGMYEVSDVSNAVFTLEAPVFIPPPPWELITVALVAIVVVLILVVTCFLKRKQTK